MTRRFVASLCLVAGVGLALSACSNPRKALGLDKHVPDEFSVVERAPLSLPPDYDLRPPEPGKDRPQEKNPTDQARQAVFGNSDTGNSLAGTGFSLSGFGSTSTDTPSAPRETAGEELLMKSAGADQATPDIRQIVNRESSVLAQESKSFTDELVFWRKPDQPGTVVDAEKEAKRIRNNQALGKPVTDGETPQIKRHKKALLEGIF